MQDCSIDWEPEQGRGSTALVFHVDDPGVYHENNLRDLWQGVMEATPPSIRVSRITVLSKQEIKDAGRASLFDDSASQVQKVFEYLRSLGQEKAAGIASTSRIEVQWDSIVQRATVVLRINQQSCVEMWADKESLEHLERWKTLEFQLDMGLRAVLGASIDVRILPEMADAATDQTGLNNCFFKTEKTISHDELRFRSPTEVTIYEELKKRRLLFFPNAAAVLGGQNANKREPDFLICDQGRWGVLEVMGETYHPNATKDHDRARLFQEHGLLCIHFYPSQRCDKEPGAVVDEFLRLLRSY